MTDIDDVRALIRAAGARACHEDAMLQAWTRGLPLDAGRRRAATFLPAALRTALPSIASNLSRLAQVHSEHADGDGSVRLLIGLADGQSVESVLLPRDGVCVSTQVGCAVGCTFCMSGRGGLARQLGAAEIVAQVALARTRRAVRKVVFMGMGEPAHNLERVMAAIELLAEAGGIAHKQLVFSTVGDRRVFERLRAGRVRPALALSLHTTRAELRAELLPHAPRIDPRELVALADAYARATRYPIQYQWTLLEGVNDGDDEVDAIARLLAGQYAVMNFILWNRVDSTSFGRPSRERAAEMVRMLQRRGVLAKLRDSAGQAVDAGCGQLRARSVERRVPVAMHRASAAPRVSIP
jgi:23S rRNA (adenine2503-C2)-methyltransferase